MTSKAQRNNGYPLPDTIVPSDTICIQFTFPDTPEYRRAVKGQLQQLGKWWFWEKSYISGDTRASQAAELFRDAVVNDYTEGCSMDCTEVVECLQTDADYIAFQGNILAQTEINTQSHVSQLDADYDGTPQSIGANIPIGVPDSSQQNALCYALNSYIELYCASKSALIQRKNLLQILWSRIRGALNRIFSSYIDLIAPVYTPNIYNCWVSDNDALTAMADTSAIIDVVCCLLSNLQGVAMSLANFNNALLTCATSLTGTAGDIACVMETDNNTDLYLMFLETYNNSLQQQIDGATLECPCTSDYPNLIVGLGTCNEGKLFGNLIHLGGSRWRAEAQNDSEGSWWMQFTEENQQLFKCVNVVSIQGGIPFRRYCDSNGDLQGGDFGLPPNNVTISFYRSSRNNPQNNQTIYEFDAIWP